MVIKKESFYHALVQSYISLIGIKAQSEVATESGHIDLVVEVDTFIYIFEFKLTRSPESALKQIEDHNYQERYLSAQKTVILVGLTFARNEKGGKTEVSCTWKILTR